MNVTVTSPRPLLFDRPRGDLVVAAAAVLLSVLLSLWAAYLDPVIDDAGVSVIRAAGHFAAGDWRAGVAAADSPFHSWLAAWLIGVTGLSAEQGAHALGSGFFVLLVLGFIALAAVLGGDHRARVLAAAVVLLHPSLNGFRAGISADGAYWACQLWSVAGFMHYAASGERRALVWWAAAGLAALLFRLEALLFLLVPSLWLGARAAGGERRKAVTAVVVAAAAGIFLCYASWRQALDGGASLGTALAHPIDHLATGWRQLGRALSFKLEALRGGFMDEFSRSYDHAALLATMVLMTTAGLVKTLGLVHAPLTLHALATVRRLLCAPVRHWWGVFLAVAVGLLGVSACTAFSAGPRAAMTGALILLALVPLSLTRLHRQHPRVFAVILAAVLIAGLAGLDLRTDRHHLREAGWWLRDHAPAGSELYSNSRVVTYYAGLDSGERPSRYTWRHAMNTVHRDQWREYDYLALVINHEDRHREAALQRWLELEPVRIVSSENGDRVLIFRTGR